jgi:hypothetical protein
MNHGLDITADQEKHICTLYEFDSLPFNQYPRNDIETIHANSFNELLIEIGNKGWHDLIGKNK